MLALLVTALNCLVLAGYDVLAFKYIGKRLATGRIAFVALVAYAISHNVGFAALSGASVRYRFYSRWGVSAEELSRIVFSYSVTFWLGLLFFGGLSFATSPLSAVTFLPDATIMRVTGWLLILPVFLFLAATAVWREPIRLRALSFPMPSPGLALTQFLLSTVDWILAGSVFYLLLPATAPHFLTFLGAFLIAVLVGMVSHVPGGAGVSKA